MTQMLEQPTPPRPDVPLPVDDTPPAPASHLTAARILLAFAVVAIAVWLLTGIYSVSASEVAIVERLGSFVGSVDATGIEHAALVQTGLHWGLPWPLDVVHKIPVNQSLVIDIKDFNTTPLEYQQYKNKLMTEQGWPKSVVDAVFDPYLITADKNVLHATITVQYRIQDPEKYLLSVAHTGLVEGALVAERNAMLKQVALHALIKEVADTPIDGALYTGRTDLVNRLTDTTQKEAKELNLGVQIDRVNIPEITWPAVLDKVFNMASQAHADAERARLLAQQDAESEITKAKTGDVAQTLANAQAYKNQMIKGAQGEAERFKLVYQRYQAAPDITRLSIYADTMSTIFQGVTRTVFVQKGQKAWLPLDPVDEKPQVITAGQAQLGAPTGMENGRKMNGPGT